MVGKIETFVRSPHLPMWLAAFGNIALAAVAIWTLPPILEDVRLKEEVQSLRDSRRVLSENVAKLKDELQLVETASIRAQSELKRSSEDLEKLNRMHTDAREDIRIARQEVQELRTEAKEERQKSEQILRLSIAREEVDRARVLQLEEVRRKAEEELVAARRAQRVFILESLATKAKSLASSQRSALNLSEKTVRIFGVNQNLARIDNSWLPGAYFGFFNESLIGIRRGSASDVFIGRSIVENLLNEKEWELLSVDDRRLLQGGVRDYIQTRKEVFDTRLEVSPDLIREMGDVILKAIRVKQAREKSQVIEVEPSEAARVPTIADESKIEALSKKLQTDLSLEKNAIVERLKSFEEEIDRMVQALVPAPSK